MGELKSTKQCSSMYCNLDNLLPNDDIIAKFKYIDNVILYV